MERRASPPVNGLRLMRRGRSRALSKRNPTASFINVLGSDKLRLADLRHRTPAEQQKQKSQCDFVIR